MIPIIKQEKPLRKRSRFSIVFSQRAAGGGIAAGQGRWEWASEGELKVTVGEPERVLR